MNTQAAFTEIAEPEKSDAGRARQALRILYVDDMPELREVMQIFAGELGDALETAATGQSALVLLAETPERFDLVITDHLMPGMDGRELVERLRALSFRGKVAVLTSGLKPNEAARYRELGVDAILEKPLSAQGYADALAHLFPI